MLSKIRGAFGRVTRKIWGLGAELRADVNHYHLQLASPRGNLSQAVQWLNVSYAVWFNRRNGRVGPLFQGRFKAVVHEPRESGWLIHEYLHLNPVRLKRFGAAKTDRTRPSEEQFREMSKELNTYRWSSFGAYAGLVPVPPWLAVKAVYALMPSLGGGVKKRAAMYRKHFAELLTSDDLGSSWKEQLIAGLVIGGEAFVEKVRGLVAGDRNEQTALRALEKPPLEWEQITAAVAKVWGQEWEAVSERHGDPAEN